MTSQQILEKALLKAHKNGWEPLHTIDWKNVEIQQWQGSGLVGIALLYGTKDEATHWVRELEGIIYNHEFAQALWGKEPIHIYADVHTVETNWKAHLQQMVVTDDPIKYLGQNL